jgi:hypothetical protein
MLCLSTESQVVKTAAQLARDLRVKPTTVLDLIRLLGIRPARHPVNGRAFGLTPEECEQIERRLEPVEEDRRAAV